jgi:rhodanese-related sulfurtransferase
VTAVAGRTIDDVLAEARRRLPARVRAAELSALMAAGALVVDTRSEAQRRRDGELPGAVVLERNVLEWRLDPASPHRLTDAGDYERKIVVVCDEGYASSLAAASLQDLGLVNATDLDGGYQAWLRVIPARGD